MLMKKVLLLFVVLATHSLLAQNYPRWFLFPGEVHCSKVATVVTHPPTYYRDSAIAFSFRLGCDALARYTSMQITGGQAFWSTEAGVHSMGASYEQQYDTALADFYQSTLSVLDSYIDKQKTVVLVGDSTCGVDDALRSIVSMKSIKQPRWVEQLPDDKHYHYGVGFSEQFYYETSSWQTAEKNMYMALARSLRVTMVGMQKKDAIEAQDIRDEQINVTLNNVEILERWKDSEKKIFYVLARMRK